MKYTLLGFCCQHLKLLRNILLNHYLITRTHIRRIPFHLLIKKQTIHSTIVEYVKSTKEDFQSPLHTEQYNKALSAAEHSHAINTITYDDR